MSTPLADGVRGFPLLPRVVVGIPRISVGRDLGVGGRTVYSEHIETWDPLDIPSGFFFGGRDLMAFVLLYETLVLHVFICC